MNQTVNKQLLERWAAFGKAMQKAGSELPRHLIAETEQAIAAAEQAHQAEPATWKPGHRPPSVFKTSEAGRQFVAEFFANALLRHDFSSYIKGHLAADFACALSDGLHAMQTVQQQAEPVAWAGYNVMDANADKQGDWPERLIRQRVFSDGPDKPGYGQESVPLVHLQPTAARPPAVADRDAIRRVFMAHGFTIKDGQTDLKPYVYEAAEALLRELSPAVAVPEGYALVPIEPTEEQWGGLARDIIMAFDLGGKSPASLLANMRLKWGELPEWMRKELHDPESNAVLSKGTRAVLIYRAMIAASPQGTPRSAALADIAAERRRQMEAEGWTPDGDDRLFNGQLATAAGYYALSSGWPHARDIGYGIQPQYWPFNRDWWKPTTARRNLVKAGALIAAEIERLDRAAQKGGEA